MAVVDQFLAIHRPVLGDVLQARRFFRGQFVGGERPPLGRILGLEPPPTGEVFFVEKRREALGRFPGLNGLACSETDDRNRDHRHGTIEPSECFHFEHPNLGHTILGAEPQFASQNLAKRPV